MEERLENYALSSDMQKVSALSKVGLVGFGSRGQDIARMISAKGIEIVAIDVSEERIEKANEEFEKTLDMLINRWGLTGSEKRAILSRITTTTDYNMLTGCDMVIVSINPAPSLDSVEVRRSIFSEVEKVVSGKCVLASNTSTILISEIASCLTNPERVVGLHFIEPAPTVKVVEIERGLKTNEETVEIVNQLVKILGKKSIEVKESPGNISTRLIAPLINEAVQILMEGIGSIEDIDEIMKLGYGLQFGPFEMADKIGLDKVLRSMTNLFNEFGDSKYKPNPLLKRLVRSNHLGKIAGEGFYVYSENGVKKARNNF